MAFGGNPDTMRKHYIALDAIAVSDRVMDAIQGNRAGETEGGPPEGEEAGGSDPTPEEGSPTS